MEERRSRRQALLDLASGRKPDYTPAGFFLHFAPEFHRGSAAVDKHEEFFRATDMDIVKIQFELPMPSLEVNSPSDWAKIPRLDADFMAPQLEVVKEVVNRVKEEAAIVLTLYSPFMLAGSIGGAERLDHDLEHHPDQAAKGIESLAGDLARFIRDCAAAGVDGFYHSTQGGEAIRFRGPGTFLEWIKPYDLAALEAVPKSCPVNILHICDYHRERFGAYEDLSMFLDYPGQIVSCATVNFTATQIADFFGRPFLGGMDRKGAIAAGDEAAIRAAAREALQAAPERFMLGADCTVPGDTPWSNLRMAIETAHSG